MSTVRNSLAIVCILYTCWSLLITKSEAQTLAVIAYSAVVSFDLDIRKRKGPRQVVLTPGVCEGQNRNTVSIMSNNGSHNVATPCSTYKYGEPNHLRCDYDDQACTTCACECQHAACPVFVCGDGMVNGNEECDRGMQTEHDDIYNADGCTNDCKVQCDWTCPTHCQGSWWECDKVYQNSGIDSTAIPGTCVLRK